MTYNTFAASNNRKEAVAMTHDRMEAATLWVLLMLLLMVPWFML